MLIMDDKKKRSQEDYANMSIMDRYLEVQDIVYVYRSPNDDCYFPRNMRYIEFGTLSKDRFANVICGLMKIGVPSNSMIIYETSCNMRYININF